MPVDILRLAAFCAYLAAWVVFAVGTGLNALPRVRAAGAMPRPSLNAAVVAGTLLQIASALIITFFLGDEPLRPSRFELALALAFAPMAAALFIWTIRSAPRVSGRALVTGGAYAWLRHPMYLAFLGMLVATGLLASNAPGLAAAVIAYVAGSELRIAAEESELAQRFDSDYAQYRLRTRWRYLPGLR